MTFEEVQLRKRYYGIMLEYNGCLTDDEQRDFDFVCELETILIREIRAGLALIVEEQRAKRFEEGRTTYSSPRPHIMAGQLRNVHSRPVKPKAA